MAMGEPMAILAFFLFVIETSVIVLGLFLIFIELCTESRWRARPTPKINFISSFKYKRREAKGGDSECAICISEFERGEELKRLPKCNHLFHALCIDRWLCSRMNCPLGRSPVEPLPDPFLRPHSREGLMRGPDLV